MGNKSASPPEKKKKKGKKKRKKKKKKKREKKKKKKKKKKKVVIIAGTTQLRALTWATWALEPDACWTWWKSCEMMSFAICPENDGSS